VDWGKIGYAGKARPFGAGNIKHVWFHVIDVRCKSVSANLTGSIESSTAKLTVRGPTFDAELIRTQNHYLNFYGIILLPKEHGERIIIGGGNDNTHL
jgi:hypothetical protein